MAPQPDNDLREDFETGIGRAQLRDDDAFLDGIRVTTDAPDAADVLKKKEEDAAGAAGAEPPEPEPDERGWIDSVGAAISDVARGVAGAPDSVGKGVSSAINEIMQTVADVGELATGKEFEEWQLPASMAGEGEEETVTGGAIKGTAQFLTGFLPAAKLLKGVAVGGAGLKAMGAGAIADAVVFDPHEERLSTFLNQIPALAPLVPDYLADNDPKNEGEWEGRLKNAIEGTGLGIATDGLLRAFRYYKAGRELKKESRSKAQSNDLGAIAARDAAREAAEADLVKPLAPDALDGLGDEGGELLLSAPADATMRDAVSLERTRRETQLIQNALPAGQKVVATKAGYSIRGEDGKRVAILPRPSRVDQAFLENIGQQIEKSGAMDEALALVKKQIADAEKLAAEATAAGKPPPDYYNTMLKAARDGVGADPAPKHPTLRMLKDRGGVKPGSPLAQELQARGVTSRTMPGLFNKNGMGAADNIPASEARGFDEFRTADGAYVPEEEILNAIDGELSGSGRRLAPELQEATDNWATASENADAFKDVLDGLGLDPATATPDQVRKALAAAEEAAVRAAELDAIPSASGPEDFGAPADVSDLPLAEGGDFTTGQPVSFPFARNPDGAAAKAEAGAFGRDVEPAGRYLVDVSDGKVPEGWESGAMEFERPLVVEFGGQYGEADNWKAILAARYGQTGEGLSRAIASDGFDGIVTMSGGVPSEIVDLSDFRGARGADDVPLDMGEDVRGARKLKGKVYINHARINSSDDVKELIQLMADKDADAIKVRTRGVVSNKQTIKESDAEYQSLEDLIGREPGPMSAAEAVAARKILTTSGEQLVELARKAQEPTAAASDTFAFRRAMQVHYAIQQEVIAARTETARALQSWRIPAGSSKMRADKINELLNQAGGAQDLQRLAHAISTLSDNPAGLNSLVKKTAVGTLRDVLFEAWINGLLSSPKTQIVNVLSNSLTALWQIPERLLAAGISNVFYGGEISAAETAAQMFGLVKGAREGIRLAARGANDPSVAELWDSFGKTETDMRAFSAAAFGADPNSAFGTALDYAGAVIRLPGTAMEASDRFFKAVNYRMELNALALREAGGEGLEGDALATRMADILNNPPESLKLEAQDAAAVNTFTKQLGPMGQKWQRAINGQPGGRLVVPFIRTPANILKWTFARTPLAYMSSRIRSDIAAGGAKAATAHARVALGSLLFVSMADMASEGVITGAGPADPKMRAAKMQTGWKPYSVKIGDRWYQYNRLDPLGMLVGMGADIGEVIGALDEEEGEKLALAGVTAFVQNLASRTWAQGAFNLVSALDPGNPAGGVAQFVEDMGATAIPFSSLLRHMTGVADPKLRDATADPVPEGEGISPHVAQFMETMLNRYRRGIPGLSDELPARKNLWGRDIETQSGLGWVYDFLSPVGGAAAKDDPVNDMIVSNGIKLAMPERAIRGVKLTAEEYAQYVTLAGEPAKAYLDQIVKSPGFKGLSEGNDGGKADIVRNVVLQFRDRARAQMLLQNPRLRERFLELERDKHLKREIVTP